MDKEKQPLGSRTSASISEEEILKVLQRSNDELSPSDLSSPEPDILKNILDQRSQHRETVLKSILKLMWSSFWLLAVLLAIQSCVRIISNSEFLLTSDTTFQVLAVSVFGQIIAVVIVISKSLWDDSVYMNLFKTK